MKRKRNKAIILAIVTAVSSFVLCLAAVFICAAAGLPEAASGVIASAVFAAGLVASGMELILIPDKTDRAIRLVGAGVICLALILVPVTGITNILGI